MRTLSLAKCRFMIQICSTKPLSNNGLSSLKNQVGKGCNSKQGEKVSLDDVLIKQRKKSSGLRCETNFLFFARCGWPPEGILLGTGISDVIKEAHWVTKGRWCVTHCQGAVVYVHLTLHQISLIPPLRQICTDFIAYFHP